MIQQHKLALSQSAPFYWLSYFTEIIIKTKGAIRSYYIVTTRQNKHDIIKANKTFLK